jgi:hypothetical protein
MHTDATPQALQVPPRLGQNATAGTTAPAIPGNYWISSTPVFAAEWTARPSPHSRPIGVGAVTMASRR